MRKYKCVLFEEMHDYIMNIYTYIKQCYNSQSDNNDNNNSYYNMDDDIIDDYILIEN